MILNNCKVKWAHVHEPNNNFPPPTWSINIYLNGEQLNAIKAEGIPFKTDDDGPYFQAKRKTANADGKAISPPRVVDLAKQPFAKEIGNGSVCNVIVDFYDWEFNKKKGRGAWLNAVQVVEWKEYVGSEDFGEPEAAPSVANSPEDDLPF
ncbi:MAG TPA: hypothetical protein PLZ24_16835 [Flavobacteriales bacterium]|nr:hypothetical protein [Flavobacteriales bacterium]